MSLAVSNVNNEIFPTTYIRSGLTPKRCSQIEEITRRIPLPNNLGHFYNEAHYVNTIDLFYLSTDESRHKKFYFLKNILPKIECKESILDIGCADGGLTKIIARPFKKVTILDTNLAALDGIRLPKHQHQKITKIHGSAEKVILPENKYDLIVISHVLYYIKPNEWPFVIRKLYNSLKENGQLIIVYSGDLDKKAIIEHHGGYTKDFCKFYHKHISNKYEKICMDVSVENFILSNLRTAQHICNVFLDDGSTIADKDTVASYLNLHNRFGGSPYRVKFNQYFVSITKA